MDRDRTQPGPDQAASLEPQVLKTMVIAIRNIEQAIGDGIKRSSNSEKKNVPVVGRSIVAKKSVNERVILSEEDLRFKKPRTGLLPMIWDKIVGSRATNNFEMDELVTK